MIRPRYLVSALLMTLAACGDDDSTAPPSSPITLSLTGPQQVTAAAVNGRVQCDCPLTIQVTGGRKSDQVTLEGLTLEWRDMNGQFFSSPPSVQIPPADLSKAEWFGSLQMASGQSQTASRSVWTTPHKSFRHVHLLTYRRRSGETQTASYTHTCQ